jgi:hypothetical protein
MATLLGVADTAYRNQATLYQVRKIKQFRDAWPKIQWPQAPWPRADTGGLRAGAIAIWNKFELHHKDLTPRIESLFKRHDAGERLLPEDMAAIQRDLLTLQVEQAALTHYVDLMGLYEQMTASEPTGASSYLTADFGELRTRAKGYAQTIQTAVLGGDLSGYLKLLDVIGFKYIFEDARRRAERIRNDQMAVQIGLLAVSFVAGFGVGLLVRGGTMLVFGTQLVRAGAVGARILSAAEFVGNVTAFTLTSEALQSAAFGKRFDPAALPAKLFENAVMFGAFGLIGKLTGAIGKGASGPLMEILGWSARQGVNITAFTAVGAVGERVFHGQWPKDWKAFLTQSVASYVMLAALGKAVEPLRARVDQKTLGPLAKRLDARQDALLDRLNKVTAGTAPEGEITVTKAELEAIRREIKELTGEYRKLLDFLKGDGKLKPDDVRKLNEGLTGMEKAMTDAVLVAEQARIVALDRIPDLRPAGDGINYTYQARQRPTRGRPRRTGLDKAIEAFTKAGYDVETNPETGEITVRQPGFGDVVARFTPDIAAIPEPAAAPGKAPTTAEKVTQFLLDAGFEMWEIISFGGADASALDYRSAKRVSRLLEQFTTADLKALARVLWDKETVLTDRMVSQLLKYVEAGRMESFLRSREAAAEAEAGFGLEPDFQTSLGMSVSEQNVRREKTERESKPDPLWKIAERDARKALNAQIGPGYLPMQRFFPAKAKKGETLGSTEPEAYHPDKNEVVEVKRWDLLEAGIDPLHPRGVGTPSKDTVDALARARRQSATRRSLIPEKPGVGPVKIRMIVDVRGMGVTDYIAVGQSLRSLLDQYKVSYDIFMLLTEKGLLEITQPPPPSTPTPVKVPPVK